MTERRGRVRNLLSVNSIRLSTGRKRSQRQRGTEAVALRIKYKPRWAKLVEKWQIRTVSGCPSLIWLLPNPDSVTRLEVTLALTASACSC